MTNTHAGSWRPYLQCMLFKSKHHYYARVYLPLFVTSTHKTAKQRQDSVANAIQGDTKVTERCSCFLHEVPSIKYHPIHYSHRTNYLFPTQPSGSWFALVGFWVNQGPKEANKSPPSPGRRLKTLVLYSVISSDGLCFQNCFISSCQSRFNLWINPLGP